MKYLTIEFFYFICCIILASLVCFLLWKLRFLTKKEHFIPQSLSTNQIDNFDNDRLPMVVDEEDSEFVDEED